MRRFLSILCLLMIFRGASSQEGRIAVNFKNLLFSEGIDSLEQLIPIKVFYSKKWVDSLIVDFNAERTSGEELLEDYIKQSGLKFFIKDAKLIVTGSYDVKTDFNREYLAFLRERTLVADKSAVPGTKLSYG